jgi:hypothetical protein
MTIAQAYLAIFSRASVGKVSKHELYDFLYENEYPAWFCNASKLNSSARALQEWFLRIHTGETFIRVTEKWPWDKRETLGQQYLRDLACDFLVFYEENLDSPWNVRTYNRHNEELLRRLEIDGYVFREKELYQSEADVLNIEEETGLLERLHSSLGLPDKSTTFEFLKLSEDHYITGHWSDCIANSRKFLEAILQQVAAHLSRLRGVTITEKSLERPVEVRGFLEAQDLLEHKEREAFDKIYGLLSHTGSHPYMAEKDQARLLRQISLTTTQFVLLRLEGATQKHGPI